ncbi:MAG: hypothetical protein AAF694_07005 [Bacteroidota bacterium]
MRLINLSITMLAFCISLSGFGQSYFTAHIGPSFPTADFGDEDLSDDDAGNAGIGLNAGITYYYPLNENGLSLFAGVDVMYNELSKDVKDDLEEIFTQETDITFRKFINIPVSAGLNFQIDTQSDVSLFSKIGLVANFLTITDEEYEIENEKFRVETDLANSFGLKIEGGIILKGKTRISASYYGLGTHDLDREIVSGIERGQIDEEINISMLTLTVGFPVK